MAKKSKGKARSAKRTTKKKAPAKKKSGKTKPSALKIGVISTIKITPELKSAFTSGVNIPNVDIQYKAAVTYKKNKLQDAVEKFNGKVDLIVTVGGLVTYEAAEDYSTESFLSLLGNAPQAPGPKCYGGVSLDSYRSNPERIDYIKAQKGFSSDEIGLFQNPNSAMQAEEERLWPGRQPSVKCSLDASGDPEPGKYAADFGTFPAAVKAVVVSADPFFQETKDELIGAANGSGKYICYPLQIFANTNGTVQPTPGNSVLFGPSLVEAYKLLGQLAAVVLNTLAPIGFVIVPNKPPKAL